MDVVNPAAKQRQVLAMGGPSEPTAWLGEPMDTSPIYHHYIVVGGGAGPPARPPPPRPPPPPHDGEFGCSVSVGCANAR